MSSGTGIRIAQALGISGSAFVAGSIISISVISAPVLLTPTSFFSTAHAALQWKHLYTRGATLMPPLALVASLAHFYLAWKAHTLESVISSSRSLTRLYMTAGALTIGIVPWTLLVMAPTNDALIRKAVDSPTEAAVASSKTYETEDLMEKWITLNFVRGLFPLAGTVAALYATLF
ncbi:hypothetical protein E1B28_008165 [Marasmius oreades]|uniref:DUF1772-domain-containing protein n=1 Tax=Marasmius oreades TaxID=181124 RepID=A0A9P7RYF3_9AGAR|nr:uncharacterized protein E1B28_008165 [Marasmius oreades]KAG7091763.1 hypothetical protein E1B28_008165 [Marasmius oreades]